MDSANKEPATSCSIEENIQWLTNELEHARRLNIVWEHKNTRTMQKLTSQQQKFKQRQEISEAQTKEILHLNEENMTQAELIANFQTVDQQLKVKVSDAQEQVRKLKQNNVTLKANHERRFRENKTLQHDIKTLKINAERKLNAKEVEMHRKLADARTQIKVFKQEVRKLTKQKKKMMKRHKKELTENNDAPNTKSGSNSDDVVLSRLSVMTKDKREFIETASLIDLKQNIIFLKRNMKQMKKELKNRNEEVDRITSDIKRVRNELQKKREEVDELTRDVQSAQIANAQLKCQLRTQRTDIARLQENIEEKHNEVQSIQITMFEREEHTEAKLNLNKKRLQELKQENEKLMERNSKKSQEIAKLQDKLEHAKAEMDVKISGLHTKMKDKFSEMLEHREAAHNDWIDHMDLQITVSKLENEVMVLRKSQTQELVDLDKIEVHVSGNTKKKRRSTVFYT